MQLALIMAWFLSGTFLRAQALAQSAEFPFQFREGLLWISVGVAQSREPLNFLLDSGANVSVIHLATAKRLGLKLGGPVSVRGVQAAAEGFWPERLGAKA